MRPTGVLIISIIYFTLFILYSIREVIFIHNKKEVKMVSFVRFMYAIIYGLVPLFVHFHYYITGNIVARINYSTHGIVQIYFLILLSVIGYLSLNMGYVIKRKKKALSIGNVTLNNLPLAGLICFLVGFFSILIWTYVYGSPFEIIKYASLLRTGYSPVYNPYAFMKRFCALVMFASYIFYAIIKENKKKHNMVVRLLLLLSMFWSAFYIAANDGRMLAAIYFATFLMAKFRIDQLQKKTMISKTFIRYVLLSIITLIAISLSELVLNYVQYGIWGKITTIDIGEILRNEFGYTILSGQTALTFRETNVFGYRIFEDIKSGLLAWIPSRFTIGSFTTLFDFNTSLIPGTIGQVPTDIISMSIYDLGLIGAIIIPFCFGMLIKKLEIIMEGKISQTYYNVLYVLIAFYLLKSISHCDLNNIVLNIFFIVFGHMIVKIMNMFSKHSKPLKDDKLNLEIELINLYKK